MIDNNKVVDILRNINDPNTGIDIVSAKRVKDLKIKDKQIFFALEVNDLPQEAKFALNAECYALLKDEFKDVEVHIHFSKSQGGNKTVLPQVKNVIAVASGKGGVGKSTISANLAVSLAQKGLKVGLMDADLYGPSMPTMFELVGAKPKIQQVYGKPKLIPIEKYGVHLISIGFIVDPEQAVVLRGPRLSGVIKQFINECIWPELDYLIIDLPPGTGDIQLTLIQSIPITGALIVTTPQDVAVADAVKATNMFKLDSVNIPIIGIVENMAWFTPAELPNNKYYIFGKGGAKKLSKKYMSEIIAQIPLIQAVREAGDGGKPVALGEDTELSSRFDKMADMFLHQVNLRHELFEPTRKVEIKTQ